MATRASQGMPMQQARRQSAPGGVVRPQKPGSASLRGPQKPEYAPDSAHSLGIGKQSLMLAVGPNRSPVIALVCGNPTSMGHLVDGELIELS